MTLRPRLAAPLAAAVAAAALAGSLASTAGGATEHRRGARLAEARAIAAAVKSSPVAGLRAVRSRFDVTRIRISTRSAYWATANVTPKPAFEATFQGGYAVLIRLARADRPGPWAVVDASSDSVACGIAPTSVLRDLGLGGCPPGDSV
jgi:hypothetical protein